MQNLVNTDGVRVKLEGNRLTMRTPPFWTGRVHITYREFIWERLKSETTDEGMTQDTKLRPCEISTPAKEARK
jgi:hypothetical protein